jgi:hypothetical protein
MRRTITTLVLAVFLVGPASFARREDGDVIHAIRRVIHSILHHLAPTDTGDQLSPPKP